MGENQRCRWANGDPLLMVYHDSEWGVPVREDRKLFEFLILEGAQAGLSWLTILKRREGYRAAFCDFDAEKMAGFDARKVERLLQDPGIIRNRLKVEGAIRNARAFLEVYEERGSFADFLWEFVGGMPIVNRPRQGEGVASTARSDAMSKALKARGFTFVGTTICYAFMQAVGMVNDHAQGCFLCPAKTARAGK